MRIELHEIEPLTFPLVEPQPVISGDEYAARLGRNVHRSALATG